MDDAVYYQTRQPAVYVVTSVLLVLATTAVILRFWARHISVARYWWDDFTIIVALIFYYGLTTTYWLQAALGGLGRHTTAAGGPVDEKMQVKFGKIFMAIQVLYFMTSVTFKTSLILLYHRIFGIVRTFRLVLIFAETIVAVYFVVCIFLAIFECHPVAYYWNKSIHGGTCIDETSFYRWNGVVNLLIDLMILSLTFPMVWRLKIGTKQKATISSMFVLGLLYVCLLATDKTSGKLLPSEVNGALTWRSVFVASVVRVTSFEQFQPDDIPFTGVAAGVWTDVEQSVGIVCACLPCLRPLFGRMLTPTTGTASSGTLNNVDYRLSTLAHSKRSMAGKMGSTVDTDLEGFARLTESTTSPGTTSRAITGSRGTTRLGPQDILKSQTVDVERDVR